MNVFIDVLQELKKMFLADALLSISVVALVAFVGALIKLANVNTVVSGGVLLAGCLVILVVAAARQKRA